MTINRLYLEIAASALLAIAFFWYRSHLIDVGEDRIKQKDAEIVATAKIHNDEVERRAEVLAATQIGELKAQLAAPPAADAPKLVCPRVRNNTRSSSAVPGDAGARPNTDATTQQPAMVSEPDYGPAIDKRFADDDALIKALQQRIELERGVCR